MTDQSTPVRIDTWINEAAGRRDQPYADTNGVQIMAGTDVRRRAFLRPDLGNISGRLVVDGYLTARAGKGGIPAASVTIAPITERWQAGRLTWTSNDPNGGPTVDTARQVTVSVPATPAGGLVTFAGLGPMVQAAADGTDWFGLRLTTTSTAALSFVAFDSGDPAFEMHTVVSELTEAPSDLAPDAGAVSTSQPILSWTFDDQVSRTVQIDTPAAGMEPDEIAPDYNATATSTSPELALASIPRTLVGAGPHYFRVRATAAGAIEPSDWSEWAEFTVTALPSLIIDSPTGPFGDPSPILAAHLASGTLSTWRTLVTGPSRADVRADSNYRTGPISFAVPELVKGRKVVQTGGWFYFEAHDSVDRTVAVGSPDFVSAWVPIVLSDSGTVQPCADLNVSQYEPEDPRNRWRWSRTEAADAWLIGQDTTILRRLEPSEVTAAGGFYEFVDSGEVQPLRPHDLWVKAIEGKDSSLPRIRYDESHEVSGLWLLPDDGTEPIVLQGTEVGGFVETDRRATFSPLRGPDIDIIYDTNPGRTGNFEGVLSTMYGVDVWASIDQIKALRDSPTRLVRMVWGSQTMMVRVVDLDVTSSPSMLPNTLEHIVRFGFVQVGD